MAAGEMTSNRIRHQGDTVEPQRPGVGAPGGAVPCDMERIRQGKRRSCRRAFYHQLDRCSGRTLNGLSGAAARCHWLAAGGFGLVSFALQVATPKRLRKSGFDSRLSCGARCGAAHGLGDRVLPHLKFG